MLLKAPGRPSRTPEAPRGSLKATGAAKGSPLSALIILDTCAVANVEVDMMRPQTAEGRINQQVVSGAASVDYNGAADVPGVFSAVSETSVV